MELPILDNGKAKIDRSYEGLRILIPSRKNWPALIFATLWLVGWTLGLTTFAATQNNIRTTFPGFMTFWLIGWSLAGLFITAILLWGYFGKEAFIEERGVVFFTKTVFGLGLKKQLEATAVKNFRTVTIEDSGFGRGGNKWALWGLGPAKIKFDYGMKTYSFGLGVDDAEATYIAGLLKDYFKN